MSCHLQPWIGFLCRSSARVALSKLCHLGLGSHLQQQQAAPARYDLEVSPLHPRWYLRKILYCQAFWECGIGYDPELQYWETAFGNSGGKAQGQHGDHTGFSNLNFLSAICDLKCILWRSSMEMLYWTSSWRRSSQLVGLLSCLLTFRLGPKQRFSGETYQSQLSVEKAEEQERTERNWVKDEQEKAFQARWNTQR